MANPVVHFEINAPDGSALEKFYAELFGWHVQPIPDGNYALVDTHAGEGINGGIGTVETQDAGVRFYVEGDDIQALLDKAESLGAKTVVPITEIPNMVTYAVFIDPQGNRIGLVKGGEQEGPGVSAGDNPPLDWFEVLGPDPSALRDFYTELFGWELTSSTTGDFEYHQVAPGTPRGIPGGIGSSPDGQPHVNLYAGVPDLEEYMKRAESLGAQTVVPPTKVAEETSIALFADPQGVVFGIYLHQH